MQSKFAKPALVLVVSLALALAGAGWALAGKQVLKIGWTTSDGPTDPYAIAARQFAQALEEEAPGQFEVQYFPNRQLGDEKEMLEGLSFGTLSMAVLTNAPIASVEPAFQINDMPFLYADEAQAHKVLDGPAGQELLGKLASKGVKGLGFAEGGFRQMINNVRPIVKPADVAGIKWRVMQNPVYIGMFRALGGNAVPMAWGETFTAVQQGTVDGLEIPIAVIQNNGFYEVTKYLSLTNHTYSALGVLMSEKVWSKLSDAQKAAVEKAAKKAIERQRAKNKANVDELLTKLGTEGMKVNKVADPAAFRAKCKPVYDEFQKSIGEALFNQVMGELK
ncbi:MAG: TRAP transporter substrate-binding protein [Deltaproteobacteria bacterium]|nr:TRAP transporter substrate-binding protein [Deltaproteobacteria bacterium]